MNHHDEEKRTEQTLFVHSGKCEAEVITEDCTRRIEANYTDRHKASCGLSATAGLLN